MDADTLLIHVRYGTDGTVVEISERPTSLSPHQWYAALCDRFPDAFQALAGGRGLFRVGKSKIEALRAETSTATAA